MRDIGWNLYVGIKDSPLSSKLVSAGVNCKSDKLIVKLCLLLVHLLLDSPVVLTGSKFVMLAT